MIESLKPDIMKNAMFILAMSLLTNTLYAQSGGIKKQKTAIFNEKTLIADQVQIELGEELDLMPTEFTMTLSNVGNRTVNVKRIATTAYISPKVEGGFSILPGETKTVKMLHSPQRSGQFLETAVVESDAANSMEIIKVFGTIKDPKASLK